MNFPRNTTSVKPAKNKSANEDVRNLFNKFGGDSSGYQEIQQETLASDAQRNWPLVRAIEQVRDAAPRLKLTPEASGMAGIARAAQPATAQAHTTEDKLAMNEKPVSALPSLFAGRSSEATAADTAPTGRASALKEVLNAISRPQPSQAYIQPTSARDAKPVKSDRGDSLDAVFSRLAEPRNVGVGDRTVSGLRSMLGFLRKE